MFSPAVITSRAAQTDMGKIKTAHAGLLEGMANQSIKVSNYNTQKSAELANQNAMKTEMDKAKMTADTSAQKNANDFALKQADLDIKRAALSMGE